MSTYTPLYIELLISISLITALVLTESSMCLTTIPESARSIVIFCKRGTESSTQTPDTKAHEEPVMLSISISLNTPPEDPQMFSALVRWLVNLAPFTIGVEPAPTDNPIPYLQSPCQGRFLPAEFTNKFEITGLAEYKSNPTRSGLITVTLSNCGFEEYIVTP